MSSESDLQVLDEAVDGLQTLAKVRLLAPDVLIMDYGLLEANGRQFGTTLRQAQPSMAILLLTDQEDPQSLEAADAAGASGYMLKSSPPAQLLAGIRHVAFTDDQNSGGTPRIDPDLRALAATHHGYVGTAALTPREQEVMRLLAEGRTVREVASELSLSVKTVEAHKLNLMRKLDIHNRTSLIEAAVQRGLVSTAPVPAR
jgi:DNA-binding NarL/FixJ family response regulator